ncbi:caspase family protein [Streptomyces massasporeus]
MTYLIDDSSDPAGGPEVHALVIGVGRYRHLTNGAEPADHDTLIEGQLTSPTVSAQAFARWVMDCLRHPAARLGSVDVLLSPGQVITEEDGLPMVETPDANAVVRAVDRWVRRCNSHPENVALFYFSGHGLDRGSQLLCLEDFARSSNRILDAAIDLEDLVDGMAACDAAYQYYFVDACRERTSRLSGLSRTHTLALLDVVAESDRRERRKDLLVLPATNAGSSTYGTEHQVSDYTRALLAALNGQGAKLAPEGWCVTSLSLASAVARLCHGPMPLQVPTMNVSGNAVMHLLDHAPVVPLAVRCSPGEATRVADVHLTNVNDNTETLKLEFEARGEPVALRTTGRAGIYGVGVGFTDGQYLPPPQAPVHFFFPPEQLEYTVPVERAP